MLNRTLTVALLAACAGALAVAAASSNPNSPADTSGRAQIGARPSVPCESSLRRLPTQFPRDVEVPKVFGVPLGFPFLGGWSLGVLLLANLLAAHAVRFKLGWRRAGILLIHAGLIVLMMSELVTGLFAVEGNMPIALMTACNPHHARCGAS